MMPMLPTIEEEGKLPWIRLMWRYRLQFQAMASAAVIFMAGGMKLAWAIYDTPSGRFSSNSKTHQLTISWFAGVIVGAVVASTFVQRITKNAAHCASGALLLFGAILFITLPSYFAALLCGTLFEGCAYGLTQVQAFVTGGEMAHKDIRGLLLSSERIFLWLGICVQLLYTRLWYSFEPADGYALHIDQLHGILVACLAITAVTLTLLYRLESPLLLKMQHRDLAATYVIKRLQGAHYTAAAEVVQVREDCKQLVAYDAGLSTCESLWHRNLLALVKVIMIRGFAMLSLSLLFNRAFLAASWGGFGCNMNCLYLLGLCGLVGSIAGGLLIDEQGRRRLAVMSLLLAGIFIFIVGGIFGHLQTSEKVYHNLVLELVSCLFLVYHFLMCVGVGVTSTVYIGEAFSITVKSKCIAAVIVCEQMVQIGLTLVAFLTEYNLSALFLIMGSLCLLLGLLVFFFMPETKYLSLSDCLLKFHKVP